MKTFLLTVSALLATCPAFAAGPNWHNDLDGDGKSDLLWRNAESGNNAIWPSAIATNGFYIPGVADPAWLIAGSGDFDGNGRVDILWRNRGTGEMVIWYDASAANAMPVVYDWGGLAVTSHPAWEVAGIGDFSGDGSSDIFWRNRQSGLTAVGYEVGMGGPGGAYYVYYEHPVTDLAWKVAGTGDFDGDGRSDILWRHGTTGRNAVWRYTHAFESPATTTLTTVNLVWQVAGTGDFNGDNQSDVLWRNPVSGAIVAWRSANPADWLRVGTASASWLAASIADIDGDLRSDIVWRNGVTGANVVWMSGNAATWRPLTPVANPAWQIVP